MPVVPNQGKLLVDLSSESGVAELVDVARSLDPEKTRHFWGAERRIAADIEDHLLFLGATNPEWFAPYRDEAATELCGRLPMGIATASALLPGLERSSINRLLRRLAEDPNNWETLALLAGSDDEYALDEMASIVRKRGDSQWLNRMGVHVGEAGPAERRFSPSRYAIVSPAPRQPPDGTVGLPVDDVARPTDNVITWHYLSLRPTSISGLPPWPHEFVHIVSPRSYFFTLQCVVGPDGRYDATCFGQEDQEDEAWLRHIEASQPETSSASVRPYDRDLVYRNGHVHFTPNVVGDAGGPPVGIYPNPICPECGVLMFHVATVRSDIREYGEGFRSAFICETCIRAAVAGTSWN